MLERQIELLRKSANRLGQWHKMAKESPNDQGILKQLRREAVQSCRVSFKILFRVLRKKIL